MKRTTLMLPDDLAGLLDQERRRLDLSAAEVVRRALRAYFGAKGTPTPPAFIGLGRSGYRTTARDLDEILAREWTYEKLMGIEPVDPLDGSSTDTRGEGAGEDAAAAAVAVPESPREVAS